MTKTVLETERLLLREFDVDDAEAFFAFNSDPQVMRHTGEPPSESIEQVRRQIRDYPDYRRHGFGRWALVYKPDGCVIGFNGLKYLDDLGEVDIGYRLLPEYWGRGIATESSRAVVDHGFATLGLERIVGLVLPENLSSIRVLQKLGMRYSGMIESFDDSVQRWVMDRVAWPGPA